MAIISFREPQGNVQLGDVAVNSTQTPFAEGRLSSQIGDLAGGETINFADGGHSISVVHEGLNGIVTVTYDGNTIELLPNQSWTRTKTDDESKRTTYLLKPISVTVGANAAASYDFSKPS